MDKIIISRLNVFCNHGVFEEENINGQNFYVSAEIGIDALEPGKTDELSDSVNYAEICTMITDWMKSNTCNLIETVAHNLAIMILEYSELVQSVKIRVDKPEAPIGLPFDTVAVEIAKSLQSCLTLCDPIDDSPPGSPVPGILQAGALAWVLSPSPAYPMQHCSSLAAAAGLILW